MAPIVKSRGKKMKGKKKYTKPVIHSIQSKAVNKIVLGDMHQRDGSGTSQNVSQSATYQYCLTDIARGDTQSQRNGRDCMLRSIKVNLAAFKGNSTSHDRLRIMIVMVKQAPSVFYTSLISNVLNTADLTGVTNLPRDVASYRRLLEGTQNNFVVLKDWYIDLGYGVTEKETRLLKFSKKFDNPIKLTFSDSAANDYVGNSIWLCATSDVPAASAPPQLEYVSRANFYP